MPGGDGTGPMGRGSMTGWGRGICAGAGATQFQGDGSRGGGREFGRGAGGGGRGWRNRFLATGVPGWWRQGSAPPAPAGAEPTADSEEQWFERRVAQLESEKETISARLNELEARLQNGGRG